MFKCSHCQREVPEGRSGGVENRNHCPYCLWSIHLDNQTGDRKSSCQGGMEPIGLTFKRQRPDKYGVSRRGELMIIHECFLCHKLSINRIAGDDKIDKILNLLEKSPNQDQIDSLKQSGVYPLTDKDKESVLQQLLGKKP